MIRFIAACPAEALPLKKMPIGSEIQGRVRETRYQHDCVRRDLGACHDLCRAVRDQLLSSLKRHDAIAAVGDLPAVEGKS